MPRLPTQARRPHAAAPHAAASHPTHHCHPHTTGRQRRHHTPRATRRRHSHVAPEALLDAAPACLFGDVEHSWLTPCEQQEAADLEEARRRSQSTLWQEQPFLAGELFVSPERHSREQALSSWAHAPLRFQMTTPVTYDRPELPKLPRRPERVVDADKDEQRQTEYYVRRRQALEARDRHADDMARWRTLEDRYLHEQWGLVGYRRKTPHQTPYYDIKCHLGLDYGLDDEDMRAELAALLHGRGVNAWNGSVDGNVPWLSGEQLKKEHARHCMPEFYLWDRDATWFNGNLPGARACDERRRCIGRPGLEPAPGSAEWRLLVINHRIYGLPPPMQCAPECTVVKCKCRAIVQAPPILHEVLDLMRSCGQWRKGSYSSLWSSWGKNVISSYWASRPEAELEQVYDRAAAKLILQRWDTDRQCNGVPVLGVASSSALRQVKAARRRFEWAQRTALRTWRRHVKAWRTCSQMPGSLVWRVERRPPAELLVAAAMEAVVEVLTAELLAAKLLAEAAEVASEALEESRANECELLLAKLQEAELLEPQKKSRADKDIEFAMAKARARTRPALVSMGLRAEAKEAEEADAEAKEAEDESEPEEETLEQKRARCAAYQRAKEARQRRDAQEDAAIRRGESVDPAVLFRYKARKRGMQCGGCSAMEDTDCADCRKLRFAFWHEIRAANVRSTERMLRASAEKQRLRPTSEQLEHERNKSKRIMQQVREQAGYRSGGGCKPGAPGSWWAPGAQLAQHGGSMPPWAPYCKCGGRIRLIRRLEDSPLIMLGSHKMCEWIFAQWRVQTLTSRLAKEEEAEAARAEQLVREFEEFESAMAQLSISSWCVRALAAPSHALRRPHAC